MSNTTNTPSGNLPVPSNLSVPINTLEPQKHAKTPKSNGLVRRLLFNNFGLKLASVAISACLWMLYIAFLG
ncbi:MAG: hypothetical protein LBK70_00515 [Clostridiales bacterium]|jgi:hypothetical protein|nr:hypothetical protein [Clostridiales bacterium]